MLSLYVTCLVMAFALPQLPYAYDALAPHIDAQTMELHHTKHHQTYVDKLNAAVEGTQYADMPIEDVLKAFDSIPEDKKPAVRNHGGGHANHSLFWTILGPEGDAPSDALSAKLDAAFGSVQDFKVKFSELATGVFGSGWAWLVVNNGALELMKTPNQDSPLMQGATPVFGIDVWEHAYYLKYQNRRPEYIAGFWNVVNWKEMERRISEAGA